MMPTKPGTIRTLMTAGICYLYLDNIHIFWGFHSITPGCMNQIYELFQKYSVYANIMNIFFRCYH